MKPLFALLAMLAFAVGLRADPLAEVKRVMDAPVVFRFQGRLGHSNVDEPALADAAGKSLQQVQRARGVEATRREMFALLGSTQGKTSVDLRMLNALIRQNAASFRSKLLPAFEAAGLTAAASDLEEALNSAESSKTLERAAQDRFARLARVAL